MLELWPLTGVRAQLPRINKHEPFYPDDSYLSLWISLGFYLTLPACLPGHLLQASRSECDFVWTEICIGN